MTFASMFPNNVGRLVIDGVVSPQDYYTGEWTKTLLYAFALLGKPMGALTLVTVI
jgi:hypothetical protein